MFIYLFYFHVYALVYFYSFYYFRFFNFYVFISISFFIFMIVRLIMKKGNPEESQKLVRKLCSRFWRWIYKNVFPQPFVRFRWFPVKSEALFFRLVRNIFDRLFLDNCLRWSISSNHSFHISHLGSILADLRLCHSLFLAVSWSCFGYFLAFFI